MSPITLPYSERVQHEAAEVQYYPQTAAALMLAEASIADMYATRTAEHPVASLIVGDISASDVEPGLRQSHADLLVRAKEHVAELRSESNDADLGPDI